MSSTIGRPTASPIPKGTGLAEENLQYQIVTKLLPVPYQPKPYRILTKTLQREVQKSNTAGSGPVMSGSVNKMPRLPTIVACLLSEVDMAGAFLMVSTAATALFRGCSTVVVRTPLVGTASATTFISSSCSTCIFAWTYSTDTSTKW